MSPEARMEELRARLSLARGAATLLLATVASEVDLEPSRRFLLDVLRAAPMTVTDLGECAFNDGPARWAELTRRAPADGFVLAANPRGALAGAAFARLLNAERELLRQLAGPMVLLVPRDTERILRSHAPDFFTWIAQSYEVPPAGEMAAIAARLGVAPSAIEAPALQDEPIRFLHLSDIHLRPQRVKRYDQDRVLRGLLEFLERDRAEFPLDLVFLTGDLAQSGKREEYALVVDFLRKLIEVTGVPPERLFVIPGNHDVDRDVGRWLLRTLSRDDEAIAFFEEPASRGFHEKKFDAYRGGLRDLLGASRPLGLAAGAEAVEVVDVRGARIGVASFNSAWFAQGDDDHGKLWLGEPNAHGAAQRLADEGVSFAIALLHHPFDYLHEVEREEIERIFERSFELVLRGHLHKDKTRTILSPRGGYVEVAGPAAYQGSQWPNGCFLGEIWARRRAVRLRPYAFSSGADPWVLDPKVFPDDADQGYCHTFSLPEKRRVKSALAKPLERAAEMVLSSAPPAEQRELAAELGIVVPEGRLSAESLRKAANAAVALSPDVARLWALGRWVGLVREVIEEQSKDARRIERTDPQFMEKALLRAAHAFRRFEQDFEIDRGAFMRDAPLVIRAALELILDGPVYRQASVSSLSDVRSHLVIGTMGEPGSQRAVVQVNVVHDPARDEDVASAAELDTYVGLSGAGHAALVLVGAVAPSADEPRIEHVTTPAGREALLLRL
ncbi:metallophosphoesterase [Sorangium sp. So ce296]|uniref:metallophosphoesterase family protein n=1 Tax=Sorangium sp. So ce296 TaxID=3133296 RepID=UPI003F5FF1D7